MVARFAAGLLRVAYVTRPYLRTPATTPFQMMVFPSIIEINGLSKHPDRVMPRFEPMSSNPEE
jgi:hypothetical protein